MRLFVFLLVLSCFFQLLRAQAGGRDLSVNLGNDKIEIVLHNDAGLIDKNGKFNLQAITNLGFNLDLGSDDASFYLALPDSILPAISINNKPVEFSNQTPIKIELAGKIRGVVIAKVRISPQLLMDGINSEKDNKIKITFSLAKKINKSDKLLSDVPSLFNIVLNKSHLPYLLTNSLKDKSEISHKDAILSDKKWYDPRQDYIKISTHRDGIAFVSMSKIIELLPDLTGKDPKYLHLVLEANEQAIYISDTDNKISGDDKIYFLGRRPYGDTSWINTYSAYTPFYLYFDASSIGERYNYSAHEISGDVYEGAVNYKAHIEDKTDYWVGSDIRLTETTENEGFYWKLLSQQGKQSFVARLNLSPTLNETDSIRIRLNIGTWDTIGLADPPYSLVPNYDFAFKINNELISDTLLSNSSRYVFDHSFPGTELFDGINSVELISLPTDTFRLGITMIESIDIDAKIKPAARHGSSSFQIDNPSGGDMYLNIPGFSSSDIAVLDTGKKMISFINSGISGLNYSNIVKKDYSSILINDSSGSTALAGIHFGMLNTDDNSFEYLVSVQSISEISTRFDALPSAAIFSLVYNGPDEMSSELKSYLNSIGADQASDHRSGDMYTIIIIKGTGPIGEQLSKEPINLREFYEYSGGKSFLAKVGISAQPNNDLIINDNSSIEEAPVASVNRSDLWNVIPQADFLVISHKDFLTEAQRFAAHRASRTGYSYKITDIEDIYKEFDFGKKSPHPVKDYLKHISEVSLKAPRYLVLMGDATWDVHKFLPYSKREDYVPSYGWPVSDYWYGLIDDDELPEIIVGRLSVSSLDEAKDVVDKIIYYDTVSAAPWMNNYTWLSGGYTESSREDWYENRFTYFFDFVTGPDYCADTASIGKPDPNSGTEVKAIEIKNLINAGTVWITYLGHASAEILEMDGWQAERLNNFGRYSLLTTISCNSGDFSTSANNCRNESYVLVKDKGFIASIGSSTTTRVDIDRLTLYYIMKDYSENKERKIGDFLYYGKIKSHDKRLGAWAVSALMTYQLIGDPMQRLRVDTIPDFFLANSDVAVTNPSGGSDINEDTEYAVVNCKLYNAGMMAGEPFEIEVTSEYNGIKSIQRINFSEYCGDDTVTFNIPVREKPGRHFLTINVNPEGLAHEMDLTNNTITSSFEVFTTGLMPLDPLQNWNVKSVNPEFRFINPKAENSEYQYEFVICTGKDTTETPILISRSEEITSFENYISWQPKINLSDNSSFWLRARLRDLGKGDKYSSWLWIPFNTIIINDSNIVHSALITLEDYLRGVGINTEPHLSPEGYCIGLNRDTLDYTALGLFGIYGTDASRWVRITVDSVDWVDNPFKRGFNVLRVNKYNGVSIYRRFDTFAQPDQCTAFVNYMNDSVMTDEYCIMATCDATFMTPIRDLPPTHPGSIDSIRAVMKMFGSTVTESFCDTCSYAYSGYKYADSSEILEMLHIYKDTAIVQGKMIIYDTVGTYLSPAFGPAKKWNSTSFGFVNENNGIIERSIYGLNRSRTDTTLLFEISQSGTILLDTINTERYPYLLEKLSLHDSSLSDGILIRRPYFEYHPLPELAFEESKTFFENDSIMRGIPAIIHTGIQNISQRSDLDSGTVNFVLSGVDGEVLSFDNIPISLKRNKSIPIDLDINTTQLRDENNAEFKIALPLELYEFNNKVSKPLHIFEDGIIPSVEVYTDERLLSNYDYVSQKPLFSLVFRDNSPLPFLPSSIRIKVNGRVITQSVCSTYSLDIKEFGSEIKAQLEFQMNDPLDFTLNEDTPQPMGNLMEVFTTDASGNKDTLKLYLNVAQNGRVEEFYNYPNPFETSTTFTFIMKSPGNDSQAEITIFDAYGKKVRTLSEKVFVGKNLIYWNGFGNNSESLSTGAYYYRLLIISDDYFDPYFGSLMISR